MTPVAWVTTGQTVIQSFGHTEAIILVAKKRTDADRRARQCERLSRVLRVLQIIQGNGQCTAESIAQELECSERTVYRDLQTLSMAGVPYYFDEECQSYRVRSGFRWIQIDLGKFVCFTYFYLFVYVTSEAFMHPWDYVVKRQQLWAARKGIRLGSQFRHSANEEEQDRGERLFVYDLTDNLFEPLDPEVRKEFESGDGKELSKDSNEGNMYAVHSSSALVCNVFHHWRRIGEPEKIAQAASLPSTRIESLNFEVKCPISDQFERAPNLDVLLRYQGQSRPKMIGIESKFTEPFGREHSGLKTKYLEQVSLWKEFPTLHQLAKEISPNDNRHQYLHAAQLIKHVLGLRNATGNDDFILLYLFYDVPGNEGAQHWQEIRDFKSLAKCDGIDFRTLTYQKLLIRLAEKQRDDHTDIVDYLVERYL